MKQQEKGTSTKKRSRPGGGPLPTRVEAVIAVMQMGITDRRAVATAVGIAYGEVKQIEASDDPRIVRLITEGMPNGRRFHLMQPVRCPICQHKINIAPCVACECRLDAEKKSEMAEKEAAAT